MSNQDLAIVILAAGKGTRLKSSLAKVLHRAGGRALVEHVVRTCAPLKARKTVVVVGHQAEEVSAVVEPLGAETVLQQPQHGTGHAMQVARRGLGSAARIVVALPGDAPLIRTETLRAMVAAHRARNAAATILTAVVSDPSGYGRIVRKSETAVQAIVEESQLSGEQRELNEINSSIYCFFAGETVARAGARKAQQQAPRTLSHRRGGGARFQGRNCVGARCGRFPRSARVQHPRGSS